MSQRVLDVVPEDPEEEHVSAEVEKAGVEEHRREDRDEARARRHPPGGGVKETVGNERPALEERFPTGPLRDLEEEDEDVRRKEQVVGERKGPPGNVVAERDHAAR